MRTLNRLSWMLIVFVAVVTGVSILLVVATSLVLHVSLSLPTVWLISGAATGYLMLRDAGRTPPPGPPVSPGPPAPELNLEDLAHLRGLWLHGDIPESVYRRAVREATRRYAPPPPVEPVRRRR